MKHFIQNADDNPVLESITCDVCHQSFKGKNHTLYINTAFSEEAEYFSHCDILSIDLCEKCLYEFAKEKGLLERCVRNYKDTGIDFEVWEKSLDKE